VVGTENVANLLIKPLALKKFEYLTNKMGVVNVKAIGYMVKPGNVDDIISNEASNDVEEDSS
jgi:hypothetical protein